MGRQKIAGAILFLAPVALVVGCGVLLASWSMDGLARWYGLGTDFNEVKWVTALAWGDPAALLAGALALAALALGMWSARGVVGPVRRGVILAARVTAIAASLLLLLQPSLELTHVTREPNHIAVIVDSSDSMRLPSESGQPSRYSLARSVLEASRSAIAAWQDTHTVDWYQLSEQLTPTAAWEFPGASGSASRFQKGLLALAKRYRDGELAGVVLLSDGAATGPLSRATQGDIERVTEALGSPLHALWLAKPDLRDIAIREVLADEFAFARTIVAIEVVVEGTGIDEETLPVRLSLDGRVIDERLVRLTEHDPRRKVKFEFTPQRVGQYAYEVSVPVRDEVVTQNNSKQVLLRVIRDKIRVLHVAGQPSWDVRAVRGMLKRNPNVELISFFILRTIDDTSNATNRELSLIPFPTEELFSQELPSFDLLILQNFNYGPYRMARYLENIRDYVVEGGGLVMVGGRFSLASGGYQYTPVAEVLPVELSDASAELDEGEFFPRLTDEGARHPVTQLRFLPEENRKYWSERTSWQGANMVVGPADEAAVLVEHPTLRTRAGLPVPILSVRDAGEGRTMVLATDSLWRWWLAGDNSFHKLWDNAMRWLTRDPAFERLDVSVEEPTDGAAQQVVLSVRARDLDYQPWSGARVALVLESAGGEMWAGDVVTGEDGSARQEFDSLAAGVYRVRAKTSLKGRPLSASELFSVGTGEPELEQPNPSPKLLSALASATGGRFLERPSEVPTDLAFRPPRVASVDRHQRIELWSGAWLLLLALLALALEWGLRERVGAR